MELCIFRTTPKGKQQVYLIRRPPNDPFYPNMLHVPGVRKVSNENEAGQLKRLKREIPYSLDGMQYEFSDTYFAKRGTEFADVRSLTVPYVRSADNFYNLDDLPSPMIPHHIEMLNRFRK